MLTSEVLPSVSEVIFVGTVAAVSHSKYSDWHIIAQFSKHSINILTFAWNLSKHNLINMCTARDCISDLQVHIYCTCFQSFTHYGEVWGFKFGVIGSVHPHFEAQYAARYRNGNGSGGVWIRFGPAKCSSLLACADVSTRRCSCCSCWDQQSYASCV